MKKIMLVFGTRPEAIKMAPLVKELQKYPDDFKTIVCVTGQHREMLDQVLTIFNIHPDYDLNIMKQGQDLYDVTTRVLIGMRDVLKEAQPDIVLVHGDTTTSTASALAAFYQQIPVGHVEAGLRTHNIYSPWPEEMNRLITGRIATYHFSPTPLSRQNLLDEGVNDKAIMVTGNTVIDALYMMVDKIKIDKSLDAELKNVLKVAGYDVNRLKDGKKLVLITGHRRENFGDGFISVCTAIKDLTKKYADVDFVYPMHLNPNVRKPIYDVFGKDIFNIENMFFIEPLEYLLFLYLIDKRWKEFVLLIVIAFTFHNSVLLFILLLPSFFLIWKQYKSSTYLLLLILSSVFIFLPVENLVRELTLLLPNYSHYAESEYLAEVPFLGKITKVFLLPIYLYSLVVLKSNFLSTREYRLFVVGIIAYSLKNICLVSSVTNRIGFYFMLLSIFPIYYLLRYLQKTRQTKKVYLVYCILILSYCVKVLLFPKGEYSYNSIYNFIYSL